MGTKYKGDRAQAVSLDAFIALMRVHQSVAQALTSKTAFGDVTPTQFAVLESLLHLGPLSQKEIAKKILRTPGNLVLVIDNLVRDGLVLKEYSQEDRRAVCISLTPKGKTLIETIFPLHAESVHEIMSVLNANELKELKALCRKLGLGQKPEERK